MVQRIQCGAALLHYGAHDNAFLGCFKSWHRFRFIKIRQKDGITATLIEFEDLVTTTTMTNLES